MVSYPRRDEVWLIALDPSKGSEIKKTRPCLVISPDEMNEPLQTALVAPMTTTLRSYPTRVKVTFRNKMGQIASRSVAGGRSSTFGPQTRIGLSQDCA